MAMADSSYDHFRDIVVSIMICKQWSTRAWRAEIVEGQGQGRIIKGEGAGMGERAVDAA